MMLVADSVPTECRPEQQQELGALERLADLVGQGQGRFGLVNGRVPVADGGRR